MENLRALQAQLEVSTEALKRAVECPFRRVSDNVVVEFGTALNQGDLPEDELGTKRGIETMFRSAYRVQMELTALADNKANMMISINAIIISIIIAAVAPKLDANLWLLFPTVVMLLGTMASIIYAILAARPRLHNQPVDLADLRNSKGNILFFGNFAEIGQTDFVAGMVEVIRDRTLNYEIMIRNIYDLGMVLNRKYALLRAAYSIFMVALILGVSAFIGMFIWIIQVAS